LKNRLQQGIAIDSYMYVEVLKRCLKQEDLTAVKQVLWCVLERGMQQNIYLATNVLIVYIRYGKLVRIHLSQYQLGYYLISSF
jgi:hypothetical protein